MPAEPGVQEPSGSRWFFLIAFAVTMSLGILILYSRFLGSNEQMGVVHASVGTPLTALQVEPFIGTEDGLTHDKLAGQVTLINYWGPWCPPCRVEMPHIAKIEKKYRANQRFQFVSVACGIWAYENVEALRKETAAYRDRAQLEFPVFFDPYYTSRAGLESDLGKERQSLGYPTTVLIDPQGRIAGVWEGYTVSLPQQITAEIDRLLNGAGH